MYLTDQQERNTEEFELHAHYTHLLNKSFTDSIFSFRSINAKDDDT